MVDVELSGGVGAVSRHRRRSAEERRRIVEETLVAGSSVARVAQRYGVNANQVFQWRRLYQSGLLGVGSKNALKLLPVSVTDDVAPAKLDCGETAVPPPVAAAGSIHIELRKGIRVSLEGAVDPALVRAVLKSLRS